MAVASGRSNAEIGAELYLSVPTVKTHVSSILAKLGLNNRVQMYNPTTGALVRTFAQVPAPIGLAYGPDGDLYIGSNSDPLGPLSNPPRPNRGTVLRYNAQTGALRGIFLNMKPGLEYAAFLRFAPSS